MFSSNTRLVWLAVAKLSCVCLLLVHTCSAKGEDPNMGNKTVSEVETMLHDFLFSGKDKVLALKPYCMNPTTELMVNQLSTYRQSIRALGKSEMKVDVEVKFRQLLGVFERDQIVSLQVLFTASWTDCRLNWNTSEYPIKNLFFDASALEDLNLFTPPITVLEQTEPPFDLREASNIWLYPKKFVVRKLYIAKFACDLDLSLYPFDTQSCKITVGPMDDNLRSLNISEIGVCGEDCDTTSFHVSSQVLADTWELVVKEAKWVSVNYKPCSEAVMKNQSVDHEAECLMATLVHHILLRRQPTFQLLNLLFPVSISVLLSSFVFLMPPGKGDKMGLSLTILLTLFVYTQVMYQTLPDAGRTIPLLSQYFLICIYLVTFSCLMSVIGDALDGQSIHVPAVMSKFLLQYVGPMILPYQFKLRKQRSKAQNSGNPAMTDEKSVAVVQDACLEPSQANPGSNTEETSEWVLVAAVFDRCFFWAHLVTTGGVLLAYVVYGYVWWISYGGWR